VEHPVTEMACGMDLVAAQLRVAAGERLWLAQSDVAPRGAAIEVRINAEDPERNFAPTPGVLTEYQPAGGPFVRVDSYAFPGCHISASYDSLVAKLIVWAPTRSQAIDRMRRALGEFRLSGNGIRTTIPFARQVLDHPLFQAAGHSTSLVESM
jgi:acetyl-CoA carboxylase biotin carboxylase subunit